MRRLPYLFTALAAGLLAATLMVPGSSRAADDAPTAMIVLDGSGSMWGRFASDKRSKFEVAQDVLAGAVARVRPDVRLGLASFGHRRRGNCSDAQVITAPEAGDREPLLTPLSKLNATGKGPLVLGLRQAAEAIGTAKPATIILIHDDVDNCGQDVCAAAADLAKANPNLVVYSIGVGLDKPKLAAMSCLPRLTGGKLFDAQDTAGLTSSVDQVLKLAHLEPIPEGEQAKEEDEAETTAKKLAPNAPPGLYLSAGLGPDSATLESPVRWRIAKSGPDGEVIRELRAPSLVEKLEPGTYEVDARLGLAHVKQSVEVNADAPTQVRINLNAGVLRMLARATKGGQPLPTTVFTVTPVNDEGKEAATPLWVGRETKPEIVLPAGTYSVSAEDGLSGQKQTVKIEPATGTTFDATLATGRLELSAARGSAADPGDPMTDGVTFIVYEDDPDSPGGRREVTRSAAPSPTFTLPAGTYYVTARTDGAEAREQIAIGAGDIVRRTLPLGLSRLELSATLDRSPTPEGVPLTFSVVRLDDGPQEVVHTAATTPQLELSAGRYRLEAVLGTTNVKTSGEIAVRAGQDQKAALRLQAGEVTLRLIAGAAAGDVFWEIKDDQRHTVFRSGRPEPTALLAPGRYTVEAETRDRQIRSAFELKAGENRTLEIGG